MGGERYAKITIRVAWSWNARVRGNQTEQVRLQLGGQWLTFRRGGNPNRLEFAAPDPSSLSTARDFVLEGVKNLLAVVRVALAQRGLYYLISAPRDLGDDSTYLGQAIGFDIESQPWPIIEFDITAGIYNRDYDLDFADDSPLAATYSGWTIAQNLPTIRPVFLTPRIQDAIVYNSPTGELEVVASNGNDGTYTYTWADPGAPTTALRQNLIGPASYTVTVRDSSGAYVTLTLPVGSDPRLDVLVQKIARDVTLITTGGVGPYTYLWTDGATTSVRPNLATGVYRCTVTDSHGAQVTITVEIEAFNRFYFSRNPVVLNLAATNVATKPNLRFLCEVWVEKDYLSGVFVNIAGALTQPADADGRTTFDVSTLLDAYVQPDFPGHGQDGVQLASGCFKRFYLQHSEQWDGSPSPTYTVRETLYLVYGGLDFYEYASGSYFSTYRPQVHPFLTWEPVQKEVFFDQPEYLYYQHDSLTDSLFVVQVTFTDRSGATTPVILARHSGVECFEVWRLGVGLAQLRNRLATQVPADVVAWEVVVLDSQGQVASETRYYQLSDELPVNRRYFLYANSVAGINTLAARGKAKTELTFSNVLVQRSLLPKYQAEAGETYTTNVAGVPTMTVNTGYLNEAQLAAFQDFLLSEEIRYYDADRYRPGSLSPADTLLVQDDDAGLLSVDFAHVQPTLRRYTPPLPR